MPRHDPIPEPHRVAASPALGNRHAWARFRRIMAWMAALAVACVVVALGWLRWATGPLHLHMVIAVTVGVFMTVVVGTGLMSLVFLSAGTGHDAQAGERFEREDE